MNQRPRRNRKSIGIREMVSETNLKIESLIYPLFIVDGENMKIPINSMPNCFRWSLDLLIKEIEICGELGIKNLVAQSSSSPPTHHSPLIIDTDMYVLKVWCEFVFGQCHHWILNRIVERPYDLYLLCNIDLPWIKDELREYPDLTTREKLYHHYKDILVNQHTSWVDISGNYEERLQKAISAIDKL